MPIRQTGQPPRCASCTTAVSASAIPAQRSSTGWSWSDSARITVRMSKGFLRSGLCSAEKISPTVVKSLSGMACGKPETSRSTGSVVAARRGRRLARRDVGVVVVRHQHVAGGGQVRRPVLRLAVRAHHPVVAADAEVVLGRHAAGEVQRLLAGEHHRRVRRHHQDALGVHEHRGLGVPVRLGADVDPGDHDVDLAAGLGELDDPLERGGDPVHVLGARGPSRSGRPPTARTTRPARRIRSARSSAAMTRRALRLRQRAERLGRVAEQHHPGDALGVQLRRRGDHAGDDRRGVLALAAGRPAPARRPRRGRAR